MDWAELLATSGVEASVNTPLYGGPQKVGASVTLGRFAEFSIGGVQYDGLTWSYVETTSGSVIITGLDDVTEAGVYYEFKNDTGETIRNPDGSFKTVSRFGAVLEVGIVSDGSTIDDAAGITVGAGGQIALGRNGIGYSQEEDVNSGVITNTVTIGRGGANVGLIVTRADIIDLARESVSRDVSPSLVVRNADFLPDGPLDRQFFIINAFADSGGTLSEIANFLAQSNTAVALEKDGRAVFYLRTRGGEEFYYDPETGEYAEIDTGIGYLGLSASPEEMTLILDAARSASGETLRLVTPSQRPESCFAHDTPITMWPVAFGADGIPCAGTGSHPSDTSMPSKPIQDIRPGDVVVSFDADGNLVPGRVTRTFRNEVKVLLNFHGTRVTPGHVYLRADGPRRFETLIDILRDDGVIQRQDGTLVRAATNVPVGDPRDGFVVAATGTRRSDGTLEERTRGRIRLGTRFVVDGTRSYSVADLIDAAGGTVGEDGLIRIGGGPAMAFHWEFGDALPRPEDFVLDCSGTTLEAIYRAGEWDGARPRIPAPAARDGGAVRPLTGAARAAMPRNEPVPVDETPDGRPPKART